MVALTCTDSAVRKYSNICLIINYNSQSHFHWVNNGFCFLCSIKGEGLIFVREPEGCILNLMCFLLQDGICWMVTRALSYSSFCFALHPSILILSAGLWSFTMMTFPGASESSVAPFPSGFWRFWSLICFGNQVSKTAVAFSLSFLL